MKDVVKVFFIKELANIISLLSFTVLAIVFNKWWIVFFSILFYRNNSMEYSKTEEDKNEQK